MSFRRIPTSRSHPTLVVVALVLGVCFAARAESDKVDTLIRQALDLRRAGDDQKAYHLFREAHQLASSPRTAGQLGFCEQALGSWVDAESHLAESLRVPGDPWIRKNRDAIERALMVVKSHIARVEVRGEPPEAKVLINGSVVGQLPLPDAVRVAAGEIEIELRAPGFAPTKKNVRVEGGQYHKFLLSAERATPATNGPQVVTPTPLVLPPATAAEASSPAAAAPPSRSDDGGPAGPGTFRASLKFVSWGLAAGALGLGIYGVARNSSLVSDFDSGCGNDAMGVARVASGAPPGFTDARCADLKRRYESATTVAIVGMVGAGVLTAAGFVLWATEPRSTEHQTASVSCAPTVFNGVRPFVVCAAHF